MILFSGYLQRQLRSSYAFCTIIPVTEVAVCGKCRTGVLGIKQINYPYEIDGCDSDTWKSVCILALLLPWLCKYSMWAWLALLVQKFKAVYNLDNLTKILVNSLGLLYFTEFFAARATQYVSQLL